MREREKAVERLLLHDVAINNRYMMGFFCPFFVRES
jgi:hypothetical protein